MGKNINKNSASWSLTLGDPKEKNKINSRLTLDREDGRHMVLNEHVLSFRTFLYLSWKKKLYCWEEIVFVRYSTRKTVYRKQH